LKSAEDRRRALLGRFPSWPDLTIAGLFDQIAEEFPDRPMVLTGDSSLTYSEAQAKSRVIAAGLIANGLEPGDHVALVMANYPEFPIVKLAIARAGGVAVPVNFLLRYGEMLYVIDQSESTMLIGMSRFRERDYVSDYVALQDNLGRLKCVFVRTETAQDCAVMPDLAALAGMATPAAKAKLAQREAIASGAAVSDIVYTSGTTGHPKGAIITHDMVLRAAFSSALTRSFEDARRIQFALPMYHVFGYVECWIAALFVGGCIIPQAQFDPAEMLDLAATLQTTDLVCVPIMTQALIGEAKRRGFAAPALLAVFNSGGVNTPEIWAEIRAVLGASEVHTAYGMTETTASAMCTWTEDSDEYLLTTNGRSKLAGPAGDPAIYGLVAQYRAVDPETGQEMLLGDVGELQVRGPIVTKGYFGKPEETRAAFTEDGWFRTGDLGQMIEGGYVKLTGRIKETYRCGGEMVMPREIEDLLTGYPGVAQVLVVGIADIRMGEVGCLCVVPEPGSAPDLKALIAHCAAHLAKFKVPKHAVLLRAENIPLTVTGRPQKFKLAKLAAELVGGSEPRAD
jgi:fatty-acyl-CoA synthase